jgi:YVTN family beta-propeller protein
MELRLLGSLDFDTGNGKVSLPAGKPRALLILLALNPNIAVSGDRIVDALWGEAPPSSATAIVQTYISRLRKALGDGRIETVGRGYRLRLSDDERDIDRVERLRARAATESPDNAARSLREALELFRGQPLADVAREEFAQAELRRLEELRAALLAERIDADIRAGRHAEVLAELEGLVASRPLDERLRGLLILALYRSGRQADALTAYQDARRTLKDDLGLEPSEALRALQRKILEQDPSLAAPERSEAVAQAVRSLVRRRPVLVALLGGLVLLLAAGAAAGALSMRDGSAAVVPVAQNSVAVVDPKTLEVVASIPVGRRPTLVAASPEAVWVASTEDRALTRIDPTTFEATRTVGLGFEPTDIEPVGRHVWVAGGYDHALWRVDSDGLPRVKLTFRERYALPRGFERGPASLASSKHGLWLAHGQEVTLLDPVTGEARADAKVGGTWASGFDVGDRGYVGKRGAPRVETFDLRTLQPGVSLSPLFGARSLRAGFGNIAVDILAGPLRPPGGVVPEIWIGWSWGQIWGVVRGPAGSLGLVTIIDVGGGLTALTYLDEDLWVVTQESRAREAQTGMDPGADAPSAGPVVERIDPASGEVEGTVELAHTLEDAVGAHGLLWVAVR